MNILSQSSHDINTKFHAVSSYRSHRYSVFHICSKYHISKASLMRWNKKFDGSKESLFDKSHKPLTPHPNSHTNEEINIIKNYIRRNPHIGLTELYTKLRHGAAYSRNYTSLYRVLVRLGYYINKSNIKKRYVPKKYHTPELLGEKMQLDVKYIPNDCNANLRDDYHYFQYTIIDEASRERFIYPYKEQTSYSTIDFLYRAICYFGYIPRTIQTDNGFEFTYFRETKRVHPFDLECQKLGIIHKTIKPRTPRHNGKVERSHRNDNERFYRFLKFFSFEDLIKQMKVYLRRSNNIGMTPLKYKTPIEKRKELIANGKVNYLTVK
ncbi:MAG: transposase family protein [Acholeplasmataceae bacterium]|nr:transposase family protein [Acholeplasmataceae bacterium]